MTTRHAFWLGALALAGSLAVAGFVLRLHVHDFFLASGEGGCANGEVKQGPAPPAARQGKSIPAGGARSIAVGGNRSCAVLNDHSVRCWGDDRQYPAGDFTVPFAEALAGRYTPPDRLSLSGTGYGCALAGSVRCWEPHGEQGIRESKAPVDSDFVALWTGLDSACARRKSGEVWCWGRGEPWLDPHELLPPLHLPGLDGADDVSITRDQVCARRTTEIFCTAKSQLESLRGPLGASPVRIQSSALVGCGRLSCAIRDDRRVACWSEAKGEIVALEPSKDVRSLERAGDSVCATNAEAQLTCWSCDTLPPGKPLETLSPAAAIRSFSGGEECLVEESGTVRCRGSIPPAGNGLTLRDAPAHRLAGIADALAIEIDRRQVCSRGRQWPWICVPRLSEGRWARSGPEDWKQSSAPEPIVAPEGTERTLLHRFAICFVAVDGRTTCHRRAPDGALAAPLEIANVQRLAVGNHHACAVNTAGELWCWGANESGQTLGLPRPPSLSQPQKAVGDAIDVAVGLRHTCVLKRDGDISCSGDNSNGQLGAIGEKDASGWMSVPELGQPAKQLVAGYEQTCALGDTGRVWCWGGPGSERVGPQAVSGLASGVRQLAAGGHQTCALLEDQSISCWTDSLTTPQRVPRSEGSVELALGDGHGCLRTPSGAVRCWGSNNLGQLGRDLPAQRIESRPPHGCLQIEYSPDSESAAAAEVAW